MRGPLVLMLALVSPAGPPLLAQLATEPRLWGEVRLEAIRAKAWSLEERTGAVLHRAASYDAGLVLGLRVGLSPLPQLLLFGSAQWDGRGLGDPSGFTAVEGGIEGRLATGTRFVPRIIATYGRVSESGGVSFTEWSAGAGVDYRLLRRLSVGADVRRLDPISAKSGIRGATATVSAGMTRLHLGAVLHF